MTTSIGAGPSEDLRRPRLSFFTRVLDDAPAPRRYALATQQIQAAERFGFDSAWVAQHHFRGNEGGLPSPLVFLSHAGAHTTSIGLGTGVITLNLEDPVRVAEDAAVADALLGGRVELGFSSGGTPTSFPPLGADFATRHADFDRKYEVLRQALAGESIRGSDEALYPPSPGLLDRLWFATFSEPLARRAGELGHGLMLSRTQPRGVDAPDRSIWDIQNPIIDAYLDHLPSGVTPRVSVARTVFVADDRATALDHAARGYGRIRPFLERHSPDLVGRPIEELLARTDAYVGTPQEVAEKLAADEAVARATHVSFQVHSIDPPHDAIVRSAELLISEVAPQLGWRSRQEVLVP